MDSLYVIDASGYLYRAYHAIQNLTNKTGASTNALYGFIRSILKLCEDFHPTHLVAVFDGPRGGEKRKKIYPQYKAHRKAMPEDLRYQIDWAQQFCDLWGIPKLVIPGVEADDTMGSIAKWAGEQGSHVYLCSSDKDLCQLVNEQVSVLNTHKDNLILDSKGVQEMFGVLPNQIIDFLAITGDSSDNIPGISGFGPKTAATLLQEFSSLEEILQNPLRVSGKKKQEVLLAEADVARLSRQLVTIDTEVEIPKTFDFFQFTGPKELEKVRNFYAEMNFKSLWKECGGTETSPETPFSYLLVDDEGELKALLAFLEKQKEICFDTETTHWKPMEAELVGIGFSTEAGKAWYIPTNGKLGLQKVLESLKPLFENAAIGFFGHNVKYDWHVLMNYGICVKTICFDTILASYILDSHSRQHSLDALTLEHFGKVKISYESLVGKGKSTLSLHEVPLEKVCAYCCEDVDYTFRLKEIFHEQLKKRKLDKLFFNLELPLLTILAKMERRGIYLDVPHLQTLEVSVALSLKTLEEEIHGLAGEPFNVKSPKQLSEILFTKLKLRPPRKTATGYSTDAEILEILKNEHPIAEKLLEYRANEKLRSTYIHVLPQEVNPKTLRIHPTFSQSTAATGRLSCQDPNLQNIPIRTELGRELRESFRPEKTGWSYLSADYSQIELRLLAHFSEDPSLLTAFQNEEDIHSFTASVIFNVPLKEVTKEQRYRAKAVNFGIIYGQQAFGLAKNLGIGIEEASAFIKLYFERYPKIQAFLESCKEQARKTGKAVTLLGRERSIPEISSKNMQIRNAAERLAVNTPLQGTGADLIKLAMLNVDKRLEKEHKFGFMILQIHDSLIFEVPNFECLDLEGIVKYEMEHAYPLKIPLTVEITIGKNWKEC